MNLTYEEAEQLLELGLEKVAAEEDYMEKVAYEEGVDIYVDALEKVAMVHEVDAEELHEFLEKQAGPKMDAVKGVPKRVLDVLKAGGGKAKNLPKGTLEAIKAHPVKAGLITAGIGGAGYGGKKLVDKKKEKTAAADFGLTDEEYNYLIEKGIEALQEG